MTSDASDIAALRAENERRREEARRLTQQNDAREDPMAWLAFATDGSESCAVYLTKAEAQAAAVAWGWQILPLYLSPRLTDAERAAMEWCLGWCRGLNEKNHATLRGLLKRMTL